MSKTYMIQWKSKVNGRAGRGTNRFGREEAERLAAELNREYPDIHHEPVDTETLVGSLGPPADVQFSEAETEDPDDEPTTDSAPHFSSR